MAEVDATGSSGKAPAAMAVDRDGVVRSANAAAAELLRVLPETLEGRPLADLVGAHAAGEVLAADGRFEVVAHRADGTVTALGVTVTAGAEGARHVRLVDLVETPPQHFTTVVAETLREFAHAVRNPLAAALNSLDMVSRGMARPDDVPSLQRVTRSGLERIDHMVTVLHELARLGEIRYAPIDVVEVVREAVGRASAQFDPGRASVVLETPRSLPAQGDAESLVQVFEAVIVNAIQASQPEATVNVIVTRVVTPPEAVVTVADTGEGIPPERQKNVFRLFHTTRKGSAGVGLSLARYVLAAHRGTVSLDSMPGRGTTVAIRLPA